MLATHALTIGCVLPLLTVLCGLFGCTNRFGREPLTDGPVANATSTPLPLATETQDEGPRSSSEPDVPFDGARPETITAATPTATVTPLASPTTTGSSAPQPSFDIYRELLQGSLVCTGVQQ